MRSIDKVGKVCFLGLSYLRLEGINDSKVLRGTFFTQKVVHIWNELLKEVVDTMFKRD